MEVKSFLLSVLFQTLVSHPPKAAVNTIKRKSVDSLIGLIVPFFTTTFPVKKIRDEMTKKRLLQREISEVCLASESRLAEQ